MEAIHAHLKENRFKDILGCIDRISAGISKNIYRPFSKEQEFIRDKLMELYRKPMNELHDVSPWLDIFVFIKKYNFAEVRNEIFGYIYENYLKALYEDEKKGQYYTDPAVVNFMLSEIGYEPNNIKGRVAQDKISIIDPSCGSGTFLYSAVDALVKAMAPDSEELAKKTEELVNNNIFGLDIAEFPLYLAEMNILMRMLPLIINEKYNNPVEKKIKVFKTKDSIAEFMNTALRNTINDIDVAAEKNKGQRFFEFKCDLDLGYSSYVRDEGDLEEMKCSLENGPRCPRRRFDFVIGNPPYVSYNQCCRQGVLVFNLIKEGRVKLNDIYGVNLHSVPANPKRYRPNPNLYAFFLSLGLALLKDNALLCYIIPQTVLVNPDFDVIRYHLGKFTTIERIFTFRGKMFVGRGLGQNRPVATSSLVIVTRRKHPDREHYVEVVNHEDPTREIGEVLKDILVGRNVSKKKILQNTFVESIDNWNFIKLGERVFNLLEAYRQRTEGMATYCTHSLAANQFGSRFYFDGGYSIDERKFLSEPVKGLENYVCPKLDEHFWTIRRWIGYWPNVREARDKMFIKLRQGNQGYKFLESKYKVMWSYNNTTRFFFTDVPVIWARNKSLGIGSDDKNEAMYLFALLNAPMTKLILDRIVKVEQEDRRTILVSLQIVKDQIRIPKVGAHNEAVKDEVIKRVEEMLALEEATLSALVDFSGVMMQKFDSIKVVGNNLVLRKGPKEKKLTIKCTRDVVEKAIAERYATEELEFEGAKVLLSELKALPAIDFKRQAELKDYIDDLVFALYFNVPLANVELEYANEIKKACEKSTYYRLLKKFA